MSDAPSFEFSNELFQKFSEQMQTGSVFESEGCKGNEELEAEQERINASNRIKMLSWTLSKMEDDLEEEKRKVNEYQIQLTQAELENTALQTQKKSLENSLKATNELYEKLKNQIEERSVEIEAPTPLEVPSEEPLVKENPLESSVLDVLKDQISQLKNLFHKQEGTLEQFHNTLEENKSKNQELVALMHEFKDTEGSLIRSKTRIPQTEDYMHSRNAGDYSQFMSSLLSYDGSYYEEEPESIVERHYEPIVQRGSIRERFMSASYILALKV